MTSLTFAVPKLPTTKVFYFDVEGQGLECRWDISKPLYMLCLLVVDEQGKASIEKHFSINNGTNRVKQLLVDGYLGIAHNAKFDLCALNTRGLNHTVVKGELSIACTMAMEYNRASNLPSYSLDALTGLKSDIVADAVKSGLIDVGTKKTNFWGVDHSNNKELIKLMTDYCVGDLKATKVLYERLAVWYNLDEHSKFRQGLLNIEFPMLSVLEHMERKGFFVSTDLLDNLTNRVDTDYKTYEATLDKVSYGLPKLQWDKELNEYVPVVKEYSGGRYKHEANIKHYIDNNGIKTATEPYTVYDYCPLVPYNSAAATGHTYWLLKRECPEVLENTPTTPKGKPQLNKEYFAYISEQLPDHLPIAKFLKSTKDLQICRTIEKHVRDGRVHSSFNNCLTRTGRLSSSDPNIQNLSRADKDSTSIASGFRQMFKACDDAHVLLVGDLDRIEIVVLAWYLLKAQQDSSLADVCNTPGSDPHQANADKWGCSRTVAKTLIFLLVYGGGAGLIFRRRMSSSLKEAERMVSEVDRTQPSINKLKESVWATVRKRGYLTNPFGMRGLYPELYAKNKWERYRGERQSFNCLIQRTARDVLNLLVIETLPVVLKHGASIVNIVHDEVIIECRKDVADSLLLELNKIWNIRKDLLPGVVINADFNIGVDWYSAKG